jgi:hypothetical protein
LKIKEDSYRKDRLLATYYSCSRGNIHEHRTNKEKGMVIKIDMENAFDQVRHSFLLDAMHKFGFIPLIIRWIEACISTPWITPLVND